MNDLSSSLIIDIDNDNIEFEIIDDDNNNINNEIDNDISLLDLDLPDPNDNSQNILTCSGCFQQMERVMMFVTNSGVCDHSFCSNCTNTFQQQSNNGIFKCPSCNKDVIAVCENKYAMELISIINNNSNSSQQLEELENQNKILQDQLNEQRQEYDLIIQQRLKEREKMKEFLQNERQNNSQLKQEMENIINSYNLYKENSAKIINEMKQRIVSTKKSSEIQIQQLEIERKRLLEMQQNEKEHSSEVMNNLKTKISQMEGKLRANTNLQNNLERMCKQTIKELHEREGEVKSVRLQMRKEMGFKKESQNESIIDTFSKGFSSLIWNSDSKISLNPNLVHFINEYELYEIRGNRKDGSVRKAKLLKTDKIVALKHITFNSNILPSQSVISTISSYWYKKTEQDIEMERINKEKEKIKAFREAMLLFKLNCEYIISLDAIITSSKLGEFYLQLPYIEFDLGYAMEVRGDSLNDNLICYIIYQILLGVYYLHSANIVHRHISPGTILTNDLHRVYIGGLSYAISIENALPYPPVPKEQLGSIAPELLYMNSDQQPPSAWKSIDMWAVGTILLFLLGKKTLFKGTQKLQVLESIFMVNECTPNSWNKLITKFGVLNEVYKIIEKKKHLRKSLKDYLPNISDNCYDLLTKLLKFNPDSRILIEDALNHPYFNILSSKSIPSACTIGFELTDNYISEFVSTYCPTIFPSS